MLQIQTGQRIGTYRVTGFLGRGAFAQVHLAEGLDGRTVALKVGDQSGGGRLLERFPDVTDERSPAQVSPDECPAEALFLDPAHGARPEMLDAAEVDELLEREAELLAHASGGPVPELYDVIRPEGRPVLVMEHVPGRTLRQRIRSLEGVRLRWLDAVCDALGELRDLGWSCHGDLKPENVMVTDDDRVVLLDPLPENVHDDRIVATPSYNPFLRWDEKGDVHAVAIVLYELLGCCLPFPRTPWPHAGIQSPHLDEEQRRLALSLYLSYVPLRELNPLTPRELEAIVHSALCDPDYGLDELARELHAFVALA